MSTPEDGDPFADLPGRLLRRERRAPHHHQARAGGRRQTPRGLLTTPALEGALFRSFHSLKGLSGMVGLREAELLAHHMEGYLRALRESEVPATRHGIAGLTRAPACSSTSWPRDGPNAMPSGSGRRRNRTGGHLVERRQPGQLFGRLRLKRLGSQPAGQWRAVFVPSPALSAQGIGVDRVRALLRDAGDILEAVPRVDGDGTIRFEFMIDGAFRANPTSQWAAITRADHHARRRPPRRHERRRLPQPTAPVLAPSHYVRVELARLDDLMRMIGDLVISRARLGDTSRASSRVPPVEWRAVQENSPRHRTAVARPARRRDARAARAGGRDFPAHAVRRPRSRARARQGRAPRHPRPGHRDRQVPDRAHAGSDPPPGTERGEPRDRACRRAQGGAARPRRAPSPSRAASVGDVVVIEVARRWPRRRC